MTHRVLVAGLLITGILGLWKMAEVQGADTSKRTVVPVGMKNPRNSEGAIIFTSAGKTAMVSADGTGLRWLEFDVLHQATWQVAGFFSDGRFLLLSMEARRDGPDKPFDEYYTQTPTHLWRYDAKKNQLDELATRERRAPFYTPMLLIENDRILVQVVKDRIGQAINMKLDGTEAREFTSAGEGLPYGLSISPDGRRVAFHLASPAGYQVWTSDLDGKNRVQIAAHPDHLYFGTSWSPDGQWIVFHDCHFKQDPGHDWSDLCIGRSDGSENRVLTQGQSQWFAATYGPPKARGGGSNMPVWTPDGQLLFSCRTPGSKVPWEFQSQRPDVDHFNRDYKPEAARGGTQICRFNPKTGKTIRLTHSQPPGWDFRGCISPDGRQIAFCRAATGQVPALWVMNVDGTDARQIATGRDGQGIDHPRWIPRRSKVEHIGPLNIRLVSKTIFVPTTGSGVRVNGYAYYTRIEGVDRISRTNEQTQSDKANIAYQRRSTDNGRSWSEAVPQGTHIQKPQGTIRQGRYPGFVDPQRDILLVMIMQGILPTDNPLEGMKHWTLHYSLSDDGGQTEYHQSQVIQLGDEYSAKHPLPGVWAGKNAAMIGDTTCRPIHIRSGQILQPIQITPIGPDGEYENPGGGYTYHDAAVLIGTWNQARQLDWKLSERVRADPNLSTRGMIEPTLAQFPDGQILMVMRGSNDVKPDLPGHRWMSVSNDGGHHWSVPKPWTYEDGTPFYSPSSCSQLLVHSSGRIYWIGNISPTNPRGNHPRYPLVLGEVDRQTMVLKQATLCTLDSRHPGDAERMQISNFFAEEDRQTGAIRVYASPLFRQPPKPSDTGERPGLDWTSDLWLYRVDVGH